MDMIKTINERTSYRGKYKDTPVPREDLRAIMAAGLVAPSGCNKQTTSLIAIDDPKQLAMLKQLLRPSQFTSAPAYICVLTQAIIAYRDRCFNVQDYAAAIENMLLAAVSLGYQSCWVEGHITDADAIGRQIADLLQVPADYDLVCILPVGVAADPVKHAQKKPFSERAWFNGFRRDDGSDNP
jgi:nitroreductase